MSGGGDMFGKKGDNFGEVKKLILSYFRTLILYLVLLLVVRLMGKRQIGEMEPAEFVVTMLVANLAAIPMQDGGIPLFSGLIPILVVLGMELVLSWGTLRSQRFRKILCGKPVILIENGRILQDKLRQTRITLDELMGHLRQKDVLNPQQVQYAILETNGTLSVFPWNSRKISIICSSCKWSALGTFPSSTPSVIFRTWATWWLLSSAKAGTAMAASSTGSTSRAIHFFIYASSILFDFHCGQASIFCIIVLPLFHCNPFLPEMP